MCLQMTLSLLNDANRLSAFRCPLSFRVSLDCGRGLWLLSSYVDKCDAMISTRCDIQLLGDRVQTVPRISVVRPCGLM